MKTTALNISSVLGWSVFPCHHITENGCSCGNANCKSKGKHPTIPNGVNGASNNPEIINQWWTIDPNANIAIATGKVSGVFVVDIDVANGKIGETSLSELENIYGKFPDTAMVITGSGGYHYYFKYPQGVEIPSNQNTLGTHIDVRADGGYIIAPPSNHESSNLYEWEGSSDPFDGVEIADAPAWMIDLICKKKKTAITGSVIIGGTSTEWESMGDEERGEFLKAMYFIENETRESWLKVGFAIHATDSTQVGFDRWCEWSKSSPKFDIADQARVWASFNNAKPEKRHKESIYFEARKNGYKSKSEQIKVDEVKEAGNAIVDEINNPIIHDPTTHKEPTLNTTFPVPLANKLAGFINANSACYSNLATTQAVISLLALLTSRRYCTPQGDSIHGYFGVSTSNTGSIGELRYASRGVRLILQQCGLRRMMRDSRLSSTQALYKTITLSPATLYLCDDYVQMVKLCSRQTTGGMEIVLSMLARLFDEKFIQLDSAEEAGLRLDEFGGDKQPIIQRPSLSMLSLMHYSQLPVFSKLSEMGRGSVDQFLLGICDADDIYFKEEQPRELDAEIVDQLLKIRGIGLPHNKDFDLAEIVGELPAVEPTLIPVKFEQDLALYDKRIDDATERRDKRMYRASARKIMRRLMAILGATNDYLRPVATKQIMDWSCDYVMYNLEKMMSIFEVVASDDGKIDARQKLIDALINRGAKGIEKKNLVNYCRTFAALSKDKREELLNQLEDDEIIKRVEIKQISGQSKKRVVHSKFVTKPA